MAQELTLTTIESDLTAALKARDRVATDTLRALKTRVQNEQIAKTRELAAEEVLALVQSEVKRRKESVQSFTAGGRPELAEKEEAEIAVLSRYLPEQASEADISTKIDELAAAAQWTAKDFGIAMKQLKETFGASADGALIAKLLKEKLK